MTDDPRAQLADLLATDLEVAQGQWIGEVQKVQFEFARTGRPNSGGSVHHAAARVGEGIVQYRQRIFDRWTTYIRPRLPDLSVHDRAGFVEIALSALDQAISLARTHMEARPMPGPLGSTAATVGIMNVGARERRLLENELRLYMTTPTNSPASVVNVTTHGDSSPVNVGSGTQNQQINTAEGMGELVLALTTLLGAMKDHPQLTEVREIVIEAKDEAAKPAPNKLKLRSILGGIKDGLQGVATLQPAWEAVHRLAQMLGLAV